MNPSLQRIQHESTMTRVAIGFSSPSGRKTAYPLRAIGAHLNQRNYVRHLVGRYHRFKELSQGAAGPSAARRGALGSPRRFTYAVIYKNIETKFKSPAYFIPVARFDELVVYLQGRIDQTILGKRNRARGHSNYSSFDEYQFEQMTAADGEGQK